MQRITITGAAGRIGRAVRPLLRRPDRELVLVDTAPLEVGEGERAEPGSVLDPPVLRRAFDGSDLVVHLAGHPSERPWADILSLNVDGTRVVLDAAVAARVPRALLAGSIHAVGFATPAEVRDVPVPRPRPDSAYGFSKAAVEALGALYADRSGMRIVSARIASFLPEPTTQRTLSTWLSPADFARLVEAVLTWGGTGHRVVWAVSANSRRVVDLSAGRAIGFEPADDAEAFAAALGDPPPLADDVRLGDRFVEDPLGRAT